jgi:hypothetical protein
MRILLASLFTAFLLAFQAVAAVAPLDNARPQRRGAPR